MTRFSFFQGLQSTQIKLEFYFPFHIQVLSHNIQSLPTSQSSPLEQNQHNCILALHFSYIQSLNNHHCAAYIMLYRFYVRSSKAHKEFKCSTTIHITATKMQIHTFCKKLQIPMLHQWDMYAKLHLLYCNTQLILNQGLFSLLLPQNAYLTLKFIMSPKITERASKESGILNSVFILLAEKHVFPLLSDRGIQLNLNTSSVWKKQGLNQSG